MPHAGTGEGHKLIPEEGTLSGRGALGGCRSEQELEKALWAEIRRESGESKIWMIPWRHGRSHLASYVHRRTTVQRGPIAKSHRSWWEMCPSSTGLHERAAENGMECQAMKRCDGQSGRLRPGWGKQSFLGMKFPGRVKPFGLQLNRCGLGVTLPLWYNLSVPAQPNKHCLVQCQP
ncbi:hypothetical protein FKP32DRAFT_1273059 [Trametes sanguinea]|nr:hypothetical protein FKP32DRAFT_1273059 [Trametes sanguinea]